MDNEFKKLVDTMVNHILPLLASMHNFTFCLEAILEKAHFETVGLVHLNTTIDLADNVHGQLVKDTNYAWMRFDMTMTSSPSALQTSLLMDNLFKNIFFVYFLDDFKDWMYVYKFIIVTQFNCRDNHIYIVNKYPTLEYLKEVGALINGRQFFNSGILFWNASGHGSGLEAYTPCGFKFSIKKIEAVDDQGRCNNNIYDLMFTEKLVSFYSANLTIFGQTEPPRIVRTVGQINGHYKRSIGGHDVLIIEAICKHLNAIPKYKLMLISAYPQIHKNYTIHIKSEVNTEQRMFNVRQIFRFNWTMPVTEDEYKVIYKASAIEMNTQQMKHNRYMETLRLKDYTFLYPHDTDNFIIVVPKRFKSKTEYDQILKSPLFYVWAPVTLFASVVRYIFNKVKKTDENLIDIYLQTFGLSLGMSFNSTKSSGAENLLLWWFCLGTMLSGMLLSSSMFQGFALQLDIPSIDNLEELEASGLPILVPLYSESVEMFFANIPQKLKLNYTLDYMISQMLYNRETSNAYVIREGKFNILFSNDYDNWHIIKRFGFEYLSYKLRLFSSIEDRMNTVVQRCVDHGIVNYLVAKNKRLLTGARPEGQSDTATIVNSISVSDIKEPFLLYALGIALSTITLIAEKIYWNRKLSIKLNSMK